MKPQTVPSPGKMLMAQDGSFIRRLVSRSAVHTREACRGVGGQSLVSNTTPASEPELGHDLRTHALGGHSNYAGVVVMKINTLVSSEMRHAATEGAPVERYQRAGPASRRGSLLIITG